MLGAFAGNRLGAVRDAKGKSVAAVFSELGGNQKAEVCTLAMSRTLQIQPHLFQDPTRVGHESTWIRFLMGTILDLGTIPLLVFSWTCFIIQECLGPYNLYILRGIRWTWFTIGCCGA